MNDKLAELKSRLMEVYDLNMAAAVLRWDQTTYMPPGGAPARGRQLATLSRLAHEKFIAPEIGRLLDQLDNLSDEDSAALVRVARRDYEKATKRSEEHTSELQSLTNLVC